MAELSKGVAAPCVQLALVVEGRPECLLRVAELVNLDVCESGVAHKNPLRLPDFSKHTPAPNKQFFIHADS